MWKHIDTTHLPDPNTGHPSMWKQIHMTHLQGLNTGHWYVETNTQTHLQDPNTGRQYVETNTHDTPTRPEYRSPVCGNKYTRHTYKTQIQVTGMWK